MNNHDNDHDQNEEFDSRTGGIWALLSSLALLAIALAMLLTFAPTTQQPVPAGPQTDPATAPALEMGEVA